MKEARIKVFTVIGLVTVMLLQSLWLYNTYHLIKNSIEETANMMILDATERELLSRFNLLLDNIPNETLLAETEVPETGEYIAKANYLRDIQEIFLGYGSRLSITDLDSIYSLLLKKEKIIAKSVIHIINENDSILESSKDMKLPWLGTIETLKIPIRSDNSQSIQAVIINPYWTIFEQMGMLLVATLIMAIFVATCIWYQIKIIMRQNRIAQLREDFSYAMIHDMKTPLTSIIMGIRILRSGGLDKVPERKDKNFEIVEQEAVHLLQLSDKILTIAKLEQDSILINKELIDLPKMVNGVIQTFEAKKRKPTTFITNYEADTVYADDEFFKEVIINLIDNAIKYSNETVEITITSKEENGFTFIKIRDNGLGIPVKDQAKIFEKFERSTAAKRSRQGGAAGFGLGLNYVQRVIQAHEGTVSIESIEGQFSEFTISTPIFTEELSC